MHFGQFDEIPIRLSIVGCQMEKGEDEPFPPWGALFCRCWTSAVPNPKRIVFDPALLG